MSGEIPQHVGTLAMPVDVHRGDWDSSIASIRASESQSLKLLAEHLILLTDGRIQSLLPQIKYEPSFIPLLAQIISQDEQILNQLPENFSSDAYPENDLVTLWARHIIVSSPRVFPSMNDEKRKLVLSRYLPLLRVIEAERLQVQGKYFRDLLELDQQYNVQLKQISEQIVSDLLLKNLFPNNTILYPLGKKNKVQLQKVNSKPMLSMPQIQYTERGDLIAPVDKKLLHMSVALTSPEKHDLHISSTQETGNATIFRGTITVDGELVPIIIKNSHESQSKQIKTELQFLDSWKKRDMDSYLMFSALPHPYVYSDRVCIIQLDLSKLGYIVDQIGSDTLPIFSQSVNFNNNAYADIQLRHFLITINRLYKTFWEIGWKPDDQIGLTLARTGWDRVIKGCATMFDTDSWKLTGLRLYDFGNFIQMDSQSIDGFSNFFFKSVCKLFPPFLQEHLSLDDSDSFEHIPKISRNLHLPYPSIDMVSIVKSENIEFDGINKLAALLGISQNTARNLYFELKHE